VHDLNFREMTQEQLREESLIDLAYAILEDRKSAINFNDLLAEIKSYNGMTDAELKERLVQFYTDLNVEGRFLLNQENGWGLREWYKVETIEEETAPTVKTRKKKKVADEDEDEEDILELDEEDVVFEEDFDEFVDEEDEDEEDVVEELELLEDDIEDLDAEIEEDLIDGDDDEFEIDEEELEEER
jgi:DNA-directed RNA polymerase subunit delta